MNKANLISRIEEAGMYIKVKINKEGVISGMKSDENHLYCKTSNRGGRRFIGDYPQCLDLENFRNIFNLD